MTQRRWAKIFIGKDSLNCLEVAYDSAPGAWIRMHTWIGPDLEKRPNPFQLSLLLFPENESKPAPLLRPFRKKTMGEAIAILQRDYPEPRFLWTEWYLGDIRIDDLPDFAFNFESFPFFNNKFGEITFRAAQATIGEGGMKNIAKFSIQG